MRFTWRRTMMSFQALLREESTDQRVCASATPCAEHPRWVRYVSRKRAINSAHCHTIADTWLQRHPVPLI
eukprot:48218-Eustigmatos_ZCMA.PRE.1